MDTSTSESDFPTSTDETLTSQTPLSGGRNMTNKIEKLTTTLKDTTRNLKSLDKMVDSYRNLAALPKEDASSIAATSANLLRARSLSESRRKRMSQTLDARSKPSNIEWMVSGNTNSADPLVTEIHQIHENMREISSDQSHLKETLHQISKNQQQHQQQQFGSPLRNNLSLSSEAGLFNHPHQHHQFKRISQSALNLSVDRRLMAAQHELDPNTATHSTLLSGGGSPKRINWSSSPKLGTTAGGALNGGIQLSNTLRDALDRRSQQNLLHQKDLNRVNAASTAPDAVTTTVVTELSEGGSASSAIKSATLKQHHHITAGTVGGEYSSLDMKHELDVMQKKLAQEEGVTQTLRLELEMKSEKLERAVQDRDELKRKSADLEQSMQCLQRRLNEQDLRVKEADQFEAENRQLRLENSNAISANETEIMLLKRSVDKYERDLCQLKSENSVARQDLTEKTSQLSQVYDELRELTSKRQLDEKTKLETNQLIESLQQQKHQLKEREHELQRELDEMSLRVKDLEASRRSAELENQQSMKDATVTNQQHQSELRRLTDDLGQFSKLSQDSNNENHQLMQQINDQSEQQKKMRLELDQLLLSRASQEEQLRRIYDERDCLNSARIELEARVESEKKLGDKFKYELDLCEQELNACKEQRARVEEQLASWQTQARKSAEQLRDTELELRQTIAQCERMKSTNQQANQQATVDKTRLDEMTELLDRLRTDRRQKRDALNKWEQCVDELTKRHDIEKRRVENELIEQRRTERRLRSQNELQMREIMRLHETHWQMEQDQDRIRQKYRQTKQSMDDLATQAESKYRQEHEDRAMQISELEQSLTTAELRNSEMLQIRDQHLRWILCDVDGLAEIFVQHQQDSSSTKMTSLATNHEHVQEAQGELPSKFLASDYKFGHEIGGGGDTDGAQTPAGGAGVNLNGTGVGVGVGVSASCVPNTSSALATLGGINLTRWMSDFKSKMSKLRMALVSLLNQHHQLRQTNQQLRGNLNEIERQRQQKREAKQREQQINDAKIALKGILENEIAAREKSFLLKARASSVEKDLNRIRGEINQAIHGSTAMNNNNNDSGCEEGSRPRSAAAIRTNSPLPTFSGVCAENAGFIDKTSKSCCRPASALPAPAPSFSSHHHHHQQQHCHQLHSQQQLGGARYQNRSTLSCCSAFGRFDQ